MCNGWGAAISMDAVLCCRMSGQLIIDCIVTSATETRREPASSYLSIDSQECESVQGPCESEVARQDHGPT